MRLTHIAILVAATFGTASWVWADEINQLDEITVTENTSNSTDPLSAAPKPSDIVVSQQKLRKGASTLGNALSNEIGIHSSQFGGGASAPVIRGQEGVRVKVLQNGLDVVDMSQLSPDHAIAADTLLASQVEVVRGASTLLYATASPAGVVNVTDNRIPTAIPEKGYAVNFGSRYNTNNKEKVGNAAFTLGLGNHIVMRAEGLTRNANNYHVPTLQFNDTTIKYLPNSNNKSNVGTLGLSLVGEKGYFGVAYSERRDRYGLVGHNHKFDDCKGHIVNPDVGSIDQYFISYYYLQAYPHLMNDQDVIEGAHFHCGQNHSHGPISANNVFGTHIHGSPYIDMKLKRYEVRGEWKKPLPFLNKVRLNLAMSNYHHDEKEGNSPAMNWFNNKAKNIRLEFFHEEFHGWRGVWGVQYQTQNSNAYVPRKHSSVSTSTEYEKVGLDKTLSDINGTANEEKPKEQPRNTKPTLSNSAVNASSNIDDLISSLAKKDTDPETEANNPIDSADEDIDDELWEDEDEEVTAVTTSNRSLPNEDGFSLLPPGGLLDFDNPAGASSPAKPSDEDAVAEEEDSEEELEEDQDIENKNKTENAAAETKSDKGTSADDLISDFQKFKPSGSTVKRNWSWENSGTNDKTWALIPNRSKQLSFFAMEQLVWQDVMFELGFRTEQQRISINYDLDLLQNIKNSFRDRRTEDPDLSPNRQRASSYSGAMYWNFKPEYLLSVILSHNERLPAPMELYYHGSHLATNSFEYGNKDLHKEVSDNLEIGLNYQDERWSYTVNAYYNRFKNRIFKRTLNKEGNISMNRYAQAPADYYGVEGKIDYQATQNLQVGVFGDYVRGILKELPPLRLKDADKNTYEVPASRNAPRVPPARLGVHLNWQLTDHLTASGRFTHAFAQRKVAALESATDGYNELNLGLSYQNNVRHLDYELYLEANNLLNAQIYSHTSYLPFVPQMGRNLVMGVNVSF